LEVGAGPEAVGIEVDVEGPAETGAGLGSAELAPGGWGRG